MNRVEGYSTGNRPWCERAKSLLRARGFDELSMIDLPDKLVEDHITVTNRGIYP
jgi:hypothetical protein